MKYNICSKRIQYFAITINFSLCNNINANLQWRPPGHRPYIHNDPHGKIYMYIALYILYKIKGDNPVRGCLSLK